MLITCRHCGSPDLTKYGIAPNRKQKYRCRTCGRQSREKEGSAAYATERKEEILRAYQERSSLRGLERTFGIARSTFFFSSRRRHTRSVSAFLLNRSSDLRRRFLNEWEAFKKVISRRNIRRRITIPLTLSNLKLLRRITRTENILHRNFTRRQVAIQNRVASNIGISQSTFSVKVLNLFSRSRRKTNKRKSKHSAMLRNKETRHRMFIGLLNTTRKLA